MSREGVMAVLLHIILSRRASHQGSGGSTGIAVTATSVCAVTPALEAVRARQRHVCVRAPACVRV